MKSVKILLLALISLATMKAGAQYVQPMGYKDYSFWGQMNIGNNGAHLTDPSAYLELGSNNSKKGFLPPRGNKDSIVNPAKGLMIFDIPTNSYVFWNGTAWATISVPGIGYGLVWANNAITVDTTLLKNIFKGNSSLAGSGITTVGGVYQLGDTLTRNTTFWGRDYSVEWGTNTSRIKDFNVYARNGVTIYDSIFNGYAPSLQLHNGTATLQGKTVTLYGADAITINSGAINLLNRPFVEDTSVNKVLTINPTTGATGYSYWFRDSANSATHLPLGTSAQYWGADRSLRNFDSAVKATGDPRYALKVHPHISSDISDFTTAVRNLLNAGSGISYNPVTGTISWTGSGSGITSLNGLTGTAQTLVGVNIDINSVGTAHTLTIDTTTLFPTKNWVLSQNFLTNAASIDTTIFQTVIDSTGQPGQRVLFSSGNNIKSDGYFLYDSVNNKIVINHNQVSIGGPSTKLFVKGNVEFTGQLKNGYAASNSVSDTAAYKPIAVDASGNYRMMNRWPGSGSTTNTLQQVLAAGSTLTTNNVINTASTSLKIGANSSTLYTEFSPSAALNSYAKYTQPVTGYFGDQVMQLTPDGGVLLSSGGDFLNRGSVAVNQGVTLWSSSPTGGDAYFKMLKDSINFYAYDGRFKIYGLNAGAGTKALRINPVTGAVTYADTTAGGFTNPMTTVNDIIVGGASGTPTRLALGAANTVLGNNGGNIGWVTGTPWNGTYSSSSVISSTGITLSTTTFLNVFNGSSPATWTLPDRTAAAGKSIQVKNSGTTSLTVQRGGTDQIWNSAAVTSIVISAGQSVQFTSINGYWTTLFDGGGISNVNSGTATNITGLLIGNGSTIAAATASDVTGMALTGYTVGSNTSVAATDNILQAFGKVQGQLNSLNTNTNLYVQWPVKMQGDTLIYMDKADGTHDGYLDSLDWSHFNTAYNKYTVSGSYSAGTITFTRNDATTYTVTGIGSASSFATLSDVNLTSLANNQVAMYNSTSSKWENKNAAILNPTSLANNDILKYNSSTSEWNNTALKTINSNSLFGSGDIKTNETSLSTLTDGATITWDYSTQKTEAKVTLAGNRTLSITNLPAGKVVYLTLDVTQDETGSRTLTLPAGTKVINGGAGAITLTTTASATDIISLRWNGTTLFATYGKNYN